MVSCTTYVLGESAAVKFRLLTEPDKLAEFRKESDKVLNTLEVK
jgi:hypothetical protein